MNKSIIISLSACAIHTLLQGANATVGTFWRADVQYVSDYGIFGKGPEDLIGHGYSCGSPCDAYPTAYLCNNAHSDHLLVPKPWPLLWGSIPLHKESPTYHPPTLDFDYQAGRNACANLCFGHTVGRVAGPPHVFLGTKLSGSFQRPLASYHLLGRAYAFLSHGQTLKLCAPVCGCKVGGISSTKKLQRSWVQNRLDIVSLERAYLHYTTRFLFVNG